VKADDEMPNQTKLHSRGTLWRVRSEAHTGAYHPGPFGGRCAKKSEAASCEL